MSQTPLLDVNLDPKVKKCQADYQNLQDDFKQIFEFQERVQKETDYVRAQSRKGNTVKTMPATKVGEKPQAILSAIDKIQRKSEIDNSVRKLGDFQTYVNKLITTGGYDTNNTKVLKEINKQLITLNSSAKRKIDYLDKDLAKVQKSKQIGGDNFQSYTGAVDDDEAIENHNIKQLSILKQGQDDLDKLQFDFTHGLDRVNQKQQQNNEILKTQGDKLRNVDKSNAELQKQADMAARTITQMEQAVYCKRLLIRALAVLLTLINIILVFKFLFNV